MSTVHSGDQSAVILPKRHRGHWRIGSEEIRPHSPPLRGREEEKARLVAILDASAATRRSHAALIDGKPGTGRTRMLAEAVEAARSRGFEVLELKADPLLAQVPLAPFTEHIGMHHEVRLTDIAAELVRRLSHRLRNSPLLITFDDAHSADPQTLQVLHMVVAELAGQPLAVVLSWRSDGAEAGPVRLVPGGGITTLRLTPLSEQDSTVLLSDLLGGSPDADLRTLGNIAHGNPGMLTEIATSLLNDNAVRVTDNTACLSVDLADEFDVGERAGSIPRHFARVVRRRFNACTPLTRRILVAAAVLGTSVAPDDVIDLAGEPAIVLAQAYEEAAGANLLGVVADSLTFGHELVRLAILETAPSAIRKMLHRQAAQLLMRRYDSADVLVPHLMSGATQKDHDTIRLLLHVAEKVVTEHPATAAHLALCGWRLLTPGHQTRLSLASLAVEACTRSALFVDAMTVAHDALRHPLSIADEKRFCYWLSMAALLSGEVTTASRAAERALTAANQPIDSFSQQALIIRLWTFYLQDDATRDVESLVPETDHAVRTQFSLLESVEQWQRGRFADALALCRRAVDADQEVHGSVRLCDPRLVLAAMLTAVGEFEGAEAAIAESGVAGPSSAAMPLIVRAQLSLAVGKTTEATRSAQEAVSAAERTGARVFLPPGWILLALTALRRGDFSAATVHLDRLDELVRADGMRIWSPTVDWLKAQFLWQRGDEEDFRTAIAAVTETVIRQPATLLDEPTLAAWLARAALSLGNVDDAEHVAAVTTSLVDANPLLPHMRASAMHVRGLVTGDSGALQEAARLYRDPLGRAATAEDLGTLSAAHSRSTAVRWFDQALTGYTEIGANWHAARVRSRLRSLGVRRRHWHSEARPDRGWESLTPTERTVALHAAQGLTNQQVANRMFVSAHTVAFHLRMIYRKLDVHSRSELARCLPDD